MWARSLLGRKGLPAADGEDLAGDCLARVLERLQGMALKNFAGYVYSAIQNAIQDRLRTLRRCPTVFVVEETLEHHADAAPSPLELAASTEIREGLQQAFDRLEGQQFEIATDFYVHELTLNEIAAKRRLSYSTVKTYRDRAAANLRATLDELGHTPGRRQDS
jgi:RNA polymerase sigma factor (sigma-70 family)